MDINIHFHEANSKEINSKLDKIFLILQTVLSKEITMSKELDVLSAEVAKTADVEQSAILLLQGLSAQIAALKEDPIALQQLADSLHSTSDALAQAVTANTPVSEPLLCN